MQVCSETQTKQSEDVRTPAGLTEFQPPGWSTPAPEHCLSNCVFVCICLLLIVPTSMWRQKKTTPWKVRACQIFTSAAPPAAEQELERCSNTNCMSASGTWMSVCTEDRIKVCRKEGEEATGRRWDENSHHVRRWRAGERVGKPAGSQSVSRRRRAELCKCPCWVCCVCELWVME